jgi:hypothetical protein
VTNQYAGAGAGDGDGDDDDADADVFFDRLAMRSSVNEQFGCVTRHVDIVCM